MVVPINGRIYVHNIELFPLGLFYLYLCDFCVECQSAFEHVDGFKNQAISTFRG